MIQNKQIPKILLNLAFSFILSFQTCVYGKTQEFFKEDINLKANNDTIRKVMNAMLAMQRRAWEQGVAAQALLELGETDLMILLAKDAVVNQKKDGRLGLNEGDKSVADPASNGEPLLLAAKITGDASLKNAADRMLEFIIHKATRTTGGMLHIRK